MLENFLIDIDKPNKAIRILSQFAQELILDSVEFEICENPKLKIRYILSLIYAIELVNEDLARLKREYYKDFLKTFYKRKLM